LLTEGVKQVPLGITYSMHDPIFDVNIAGEPCLCDMCLIMQMII